MCDEADVQAGWDNFFDAIHLTWYKPFVMNCHTAGEESKGNDMKMYDFKITPQFPWILLIME